MKEVNLKWGQPKALQGTIIMQSQEDLRSGSAILQTEIVFHGLHFDEVHLESGKGLGDLLYVTDHRAAMLNWNWNKVPCAAGSDVKDGSMCIIPHQA